jgi:hypothetical protein
MPEATVDEDSLAERGKYQVGRTWKILAVYPESVAHAMGKPTDQKLWGGVSALDRAHDAATGWGGFRHPFALKSGHLSAIYCSDASRTTHASETLFWRAMSSRVW